MIRLDDLEALNGVLRGFQSIKLKVPILLKSTYYHRGTFKEVFETQMDYLINSIQENHSLTIIPHYFLGKLPNILICVLIRERGCIMFGAHNLIFFNFLTIEFVQ